MTTPSAAPDDRPPPDDHPTPHRPPTEPETGTVPPALDLRRGPGLEEATEAPDADLEAFWTDAKIHVNLTELAPCIGEQPLAAVRPPAWAFGGGPAQADALLALVLAGRKTGTASALWDYEDEDEPVPSVGQLSIVLDGRGRPRALVRTDRVDVVSFDQVDAAHAEAEGEDDGSLERWRAVHRQVFTERAAHDRAFDERMPVVLERFSVLYAPGGPEA